MKKKYTRVTAFTTIVIMIFVLLTSRLVYIQIFNGDYYKSFAEDVGRKEIVELAPRGEILDRNGVKLATNKQSFNIVYANSDYKRKDEEINDILTKVVRLLAKNSNQNKIVTEPLKAISYNNGVFAFNGTETEIKNFKKYLDNSYNAKKKNIDTGLDARNTFYELAKYFKLVDSSNAGEYSIKNGLNELELYWVTALRVGLKNIGTSEYKRVYIAKNVEKKTAMAIEYEKDNIPEILSIVEPMRYYPYGSTGSMVIGNVGKIHENQAETFKSLNYDINQDLVGQLGLEQALENSLINSSKVGVNVSLKGENGGRFVQIDKNGRIINDTAFLDPIPGDSVQTTIDINLQKASDDALVETMKKISSGEFSNATRGAAAVINVRTGEILALSSKTLMKNGENEFDPNEFAETGSISSERAAQLYPDITGDKWDALPKPMFNYATKGAGPPGSTFKPLIAIAGLEAGKITPSTIIVDKGQYREIPNFPGNCWIWNDKHGMHGPVDVVKALQVSCNYFFYEVGRRMDWDTFQSWEYKFGLAPDPKTGKMPSTGIEIEETLNQASNPTKYKQMFITSNMNKLIQSLASQKYGSNTFQEGSEQYKILRDMMMNGSYDEKKAAELSISNDKAKELIKNSIDKFNKDSRQDYERLFASIGQGMTQLTPIQMASYMATLVNGGTRYKLHLVKKVLNPDTTVKSEVEPEVLDSIKISPQNLSAVMKGMEKVTEEGGTASKTFRDFKIPTGGKTGSAQSFSQSEKERLNINRSAYGWYVGFAPLNNPEIAVAVVIYDAGHGGDVAPVARKIYEEYFKKQLEGENAQTAQTNNTTN